VHARSRERAASVSGLLDRGAHLLVADLSSREEVLAAVRELNAGPALDAVVHNAGVLRGPDVLPVNVVAPYLMTALLPAPRRHVYLSSGMHRGGNPDLEGLDWNGTGADYSSSKLLVTVLSAAVARSWGPGVLADAVDPGWVATKMGGAGAPDDFVLGHRTQEDLVTDPRRTVGGGYWHHGRQQQPHPAVGDPDLQRRLLEALAETTGVVLPDRSSA
jgi:NAD(P)-dependent dehydrogenase (short-subunit alcohol dehydrogenase family)